MSQRAEIKQKVMNFVQVKKHKKRENLPTLMKKFLSCYGGY
jgi:hypothetical protein